MSDELWVGMMVRVIPAGRYGTIREIDTVVTRPFAVVVLDSGQVVNYELDAIEPVKFAHDLRADNIRLRDAIANALVELDRAAFDDEGVVAAMGILARALKADDEDDKK